MKKGGKILSYKYRDVARKLRKNGWTIKRQKGSHVIFEKDGNTVPVAFCRNDIPKGTIANISRITGIDF